MARPRVSPRFALSPNWTPKDGHIQGQADLLRDCHHRCSNPYYPQSVKDQALDMYRGVPARLGRVMGILPAYSSRHRELMLREARRRKRRPEPARVKCGPWVWTAVVEEADGSRWVDFQAGDRSERTFLKPYRRLPEYRSDHYPVYQWLPRNRRVAGKGGEVNWNEGPSVTV